MWTLFTIAPYAFFIGIVGISYFLVWPFVQYIRDPKGILYSYIYQVVYRASRLTSECPRSPEIP